MDDARPPRLLPRLLVWGLAGLAVLIVLNWVIGAVFALVRLALLVGFVVVIGWFAIAVAGRGRD